MTEKDKMIQDQAIEIERLKREIEELKKSTASELERLLSMQQHETPESISSYLRWKLMRERND